MRIAQVAPLFESVPPRFYGGTERVVSFLSEELVRMGHDVTLFASGDSVTKAALDSVCAEGLRLDKTCQESLVYHVLELERVIDRQAEFDVIHFHTDFIHFPLVRALQVPTLTTMHGRLDIPEMRKFFREYADIPVVSISDAQRRDLGFANWQGTVYHGLPKDLLSFVDLPGNYLAFLGRISPEKRPDRAIKIAIQLNIPLKIAAKINPTEQAYFDLEIKPLLKHPLVEFIGEISEREKNEFLGNAKALLFPIDWPEPFGLVMIESLACGTPVVAFRGGSVDEIIEKGNSGFVVEDVEECIEAVKKITEIDRTACRKIFETRFSAERMARDYLRIYGRVIADHKRFGDRYKVESSAKIAGTRGDDLHSGEFTFS